jgi:hypothetical protein
VTGNERIDLKRRSRLATEKMNWTDRTDRTRKGPEKIPLAWHQPSPLLTIRHLWDSNPRGETQPQKRKQKAEPEIPKVCKLFQCDLKSNTGMKNNIFRYRKYTTWSSRAGAAMIQEVPMHWYACLMPQ